MLLIPIVILIQAIVTSFFGSILFGTPSFPQLIQVVNTTASSTAKNTCTATCGTCAEVTTISGIIRPPDYPNFYGGTFDCLYSISVPAGKTITIYLPFNIIPTGDSLSFYDGASVASVFVVSFVNTNAASTFSYTSSNNSLTVRLLTNANNGGGLFSANYIVQ